MRLDYVKKKLLDPKLAFKAWKMSLCLLLYALHGAAVAAQTVHVVDTVKRAETSQLLEAIKQHCSDACGNVVYQEMGGSRRSAIAAISELAEQEASGDVSLVITMGKPAATMVANSLQTTPIIYTMVGEYIAELADRSSIVGVPTDAPLQLQLDIIKRLDLTKGSLGVFLGSNDSPSLIDDLRLPEGLEVRTYRVADTKEMPQALRLAVRENTGLIFLRNRMVINRDTFRYVLRVTLENRVFTMGYSKSLVDMGFTAAMAPKVDAFGARIATVAKQMLASEPVDLPEISLAEHSVHINDRTIEQVRPAEAESDRSQPAR